jgi:hypothetical protein
MGINPVTGGFEVRLAGFFSFLCLFLLSCKLFSIFIYHLDDPIAA